MGVSLAAGASAQLDVGDTNPEVDTGVTPQAKETQAWVRVAGAQYSVETFPSDSPTPVEAEFYTVAFRNDIHGFAGGMRCKVAPGGKQGEALRQHLEDCPGGRVPIIYKYTDTGTGGTWHEVLPPDGDGYVGAIAFMPNGKALAVGGTGEYPKREPNPSSAAEDIAGEARAWLYENGFWSELGDSSMVSGMRGMTAVAFSERLGDCPDAGSECGLAGGYQQMWRWTDGGFVSGWDTAPAEVRSPDADGVIDDPDSFRFRVRQIQFNEDDASPTKAFAVTSGCCDTVPTRNVPSGLVYDGQGLFAKEYGAPANAPSTDPAEGVHTPGDDPALRRDVPDSFYSVVLLEGGTVSVVATPGGPLDESSAAGERASRVYGAIPMPGSSFQSNPLTAANTELPRQVISTLRLTSGAGKLDDASNADLLDWAVGSLKGGRGEGVAYRADGDLGPLRTQVNVLNCPGGGFPFVVLVPDSTCKQYDPQGYVDQTQSKYLLRLDTYGLNAITFTDATESVAWAVGDRGAIVRLGGVGAASATGGGDPEPAKVGPASLARFAGDEVYDAFRPLPTDGDTPAVPSLASNGTRELPRPEFVPGGSPNPTIPTNSKYPPEDVVSVAMSSDGSEGWAVGTGGFAFIQGQLPSGPNAPTVYHYDGLRWTRCDIGGIPGLLPPDPACSGLGELVDAEVFLSQVVRVPLENDDDATNDDEFEVFAIGAEFDPEGPLQAAPAAFRYQNGRWSRDDASHKAFADGGELADVFGITSVAFTAPDDGWLTSESSVKLAHWDGTDWSLCNVAGADSCGDPSDRTIQINPKGKVFAVGKRVYFGGSRPASNEGGGVSQVSNPVVLYKDYPNGEWKAEGGGYDPQCAGCPQPGLDVQGTISSLAVSPDFREGWAVGAFGQSETEQLADQNVPDQAGDAAGSPYALLRLHDGEWAPYREDDAADDYAGRGQAAARRLTPTILDPATGLAAIYALEQTDGGPPVLLFDPTRGENARWRALRAPFHNRAVSGGPEMAAMPRAFVPDGSGGAWLAAKQRHTKSGDREAVHFWHYTREVPNPVFTEAPHPIRERITGGAQGADGSFWVTTNSGFVYRYDRLTGWDRLRIPGWDRGRVVTRTSEANAVAVGPDGEGIVVGKNGRLAQVSALGVRLDPATGERCGEPPCGTGQDLRAVAVAPDGSALAGGDASVLLYRPPGEDFRKIKFGGGAHASITAISMPSADRAWLTNTVGQVYAGRLTAAGWTFSVENRTADGSLLSYDEHRAQLKLHGIEIDDDGEGYAVGERGMILERRADGTWQRLKTDFLDTFHSVTFAPQGRDGGVLIGGEMGLILTLEDGEFRVAREADLFAPENYGPGSGDSAAVNGLALVPGVEPGEVEAWAVQQGSSGPGLVLHYTSDPDNPLMRPFGRVEPLPDVPAPRPGELSFAAFGRSECHSPENRCPEGHAGNLFHERVTRRITDEVIERSAEPGGPDFALFTGDVGRAAGREEKGGGAGIVNSPLDKSWVHRRWQELVTDDFADAGVPLFGAVGLFDLDRTAVCSSSNNCEADLGASEGGTGLTWGWRQAMAEMPPPWGDPDSGTPKAQTDQYSFEPVENGSGVEAPLGVRQGDQARTHYAIDLKRTDGGTATPVARLIFLDNSLGTLSSSDPLQNPIEPDGQLRWLEEMLEGVDREHGQQAIVVMNRPTYSYQVTDATTWATDGTVLERTLLQYGVKMVVSGRLGWNGLYWTTAPGVHTPCPGDPYRSTEKGAPRPGDPPCNAQGAADPATEATEQLADALQGLGPPPAPGGGPAPPLPGVDVPVDTVEDTQSDVEDTLSDAGLQGLIPMVVASSGGGRFGPSGTDGGEARNGWWHGYTIVRMDKSGDPAATIVEQRPVFDWISITAPSHVLKPRQKMTLVGEGREPVGADVTPRYDRINSDAITHRYDLVKADESNPSLPARKANGGYIELPDDCSVGCIDRETGVVEAGSGRHERYYAVAILSVGDKAASWPIAFEPAKSFKASVATVLPPAPVNQAPEPPPTVVLNQGPAPAAPPPPPPNLPPINVPPLKLPPPPAPPNLPLPTATPTPTPPPPPAPPPPPGNAGALPLSLEAPLTPVSIVPTVIPPSPPPVNPAPPSGSAARKEARQRQAATAKSEEGGGDQGAGEGQSSGDSGAAQMTRRDPTRPAPSYGESSRDDRRYSFTALSHSDQPSAWSRGALYGGMTLATALALALGWGIARPTPRRRHPPRPAPETVRNIGRRPRS